MRNVLDELERLGRRTRAMLLAQRFAVMAACILGTVLALVLVDYGLRLPGSLRLVLLGAGVAAFVTALARYLVPAFGYRPSLTQLALRVERSIPSVSGRLASSVEFALSGVDRVNPLAERSVREAERRLAGDSVGQVLSRERLGRSFGALVLAAAVVATLVAIAPAAAATGLRRLVLPYGATQWPARTSVRSLMDEVLEIPGVHPRGKALVLRARNETRGDPDGRVDVHYRLRREGAKDDWEHVVLTDQGSGVHERLVDSSAESIELYFATEDNRTTTERIELVPPPAVVRALLSITPPAYAAGRFPPIEAELGPGVDERAVTESDGLAGSEASLLLELNKPLPVPAGDGARAAWVAETFGFAGAEAAVEPRFEEAPVPSGPSRWRISWPLRESVTLSLDLADEHGLRNAEPIQYRIKAAPDLAPSVTITEPAADLAVLPTAVVPLVGEAKDDVAVATIGLIAQVLPGGSEGAQALSFAPTRTVDAATASIEAELDLAAHALQEGDVVLLTAWAEDGYNHEGKTHGRIESPVRRLRLISELDLAAQLRRQLAGVRQNAIRMESVQTELQDDVIENGPQPGLQRAQAQIGDRIAAQRDAVDELQEQLRQNRLEDPQIEELLQQTRDLLEYAGRAANKTVEAIEECQGKARGEREPRPEDDEDALREPAPEDRPIVDAQQEVRDELSDLIELLDRDEDTWIVQRQLAGLIDEQTHLEAETVELARETIGKTLEDMTEEETSELDRIAQRQRELRDEARRLIEEMRRRAEALEEIDPQSAAGMRAAADTGERQEVDRDMESAADRVEQNQLQSAGASQQAASQTLQRMNEDLQETQRAKAEELLRQLASLIESIERLLSVQENEIIALAAAVERGEFSGRDRSMIRLNQNTQSVAGEARAAGAQSRRIARTLDRAGDAQGAAVLALRAQPLDAAAANEAEERSLAQLKDALQLAKDLQEETQDEQVQQQREELIAAYRALAEQQVALREEALGLQVHEELTRRQLVEARRIGNGQQEVRTGLGDVEARTREINDSEVFSYVHRLMDRWSDTASSALWDGDVGIDVTDRQQMIADAIARQVEALEESMTPPDEFADETEAQGGGGSSGPPPLIPPVAEVKRLHGLQEQIYDQTRGLDRRSDLPPASMRQRIRELGGMQRELIRLGETMLENMQPPAPPGGGAPEPAPEDTK